MSTLSFYEEVVHGNIDRVAAAEARALQHSHDLEVRWGMLDLLCHLGTRLQKLDHWPNLPLVDPSQPKLHHYVDGHRARTVVFFGIRADASGAMDELLVLGCSETVGSFPSQSDVQLSLNRFQYLPGPWL